ncbi:ComEA family DNA-binding protein [Methylobacterium brachiatum]|uniref:ComEA family DNA-binding protein n=1 Tax=Methylobacterium brachiatum TaxID=269660 RepID=UPI00244C0397|nr:helix-hairpin-helix domain-containing protein [Methylobacterium brachiatum]MDH2310220.1 helix-hairpin-helix domain-containing protein [Methylobacterium brachiatum]
MLSGPAILRISVLLILAGILAALVQFLLPNPPPAPIPAPVAEAPAEPVPAEQTAPPRTPEPAPRPAAPPPEAVPARPAQMPSDALAFPNETVPVQQGEAEIDRAEESAGPRALALLDLNTASAADLNKLRGGGAIGRAIIAKRPYASVDQLLSKRVLSRAVYEKIKDQVTVR